LLRPTIVEKGFVVQKALSTAFIPLKILPQCMIF